MDYFTMNEEYKELNKRWYSPIYDLNNQSKINAYYAILDSILPKEESLTSSQANIFHHIKNSISLIETILSPLKNFNIEYDLIVSGGAIYDLVCHQNDIKDVDIIISFPQIDTEAYNYNIIDKQNHNSALSKVFSQLISPLYEELFHQKKENFNYNDLTNIIAKLAWQHAQNVKFFYSHHHQVADYLNHVIAGMCKIESANYKSIDLIISKIKASQFINYYDFNLCQMSMIYKEGNYQCDKQNLLNHIFMTKNAAYDVEQKKITLKVDKFSQEHIQYFLNKHFLRLIEKYPHYQPTMYGRNEEKVNFAQAIMEKICFEKNIHTSKDDDNKKYKI